MKKLFLPSLSLIVLSFGNIMMQVGAFLGLSPCSLRNINLFRVGAFEASTNRRYFTAPHTVFRPRLTLPLTAETKRGVRRNLFSSCVWDEAYCAGEISTSRISCSRQHSAKNAVANALSPLLSSRRPLSMASGTKGEADEICEGSVAQAVVQISGLAENRLTEKNGGAKHFQRPFNISYRTPQPVKTGNCCDIVVVGRKSLLSSLVERSTLLGETFEDESTQMQIHNIMTVIVKSSDFRNIGAGGDPISSYASCASPNKESTPSSSSFKVSMCVLPDTVSRNNHPLSPNTMTDQICRAVSASGANDDVRIFVFGVKEEDNESITSTTVANPGAVASAVAKAFPMYCRKQNSEGEDGKDSHDQNPGVPTLHVTMLNEKGIDIMSNDSTSDDTSRLVEKCKIINDAVQMAAYLVDMAPNELSTDAFSEACQSLTNELSKELSAKDIGDVTLQEIKGSDLHDRGYGGIYSVGKAAETPPRLIEMTYLPSTKNEAANAVTALVGKGITFDTGGLSLKSKEGMPGMKHDMGGSAGMLGAFVAAVRMGYEKPLTLILCLAENAIGPNNAMRNDDIIHMYSGKTVEVNNCDAEGRLVLGDGVAHATKHISNLELVVDMATLTGAQLVATGKTHAGILANSADLELRTVRAGLKSGDLCFPLLYAPDLLQKEFASKVADMKNSVKDRANAQSSCTGHFIESHLQDEYKSQQKGWLHVDMAGPAARTTVGRDTALV